jgi:micrococcal nuclease
MLTLQKQETGCTCLRGKEALRKAGLFVLLALWVTWTVPTVRGASGEVDATTVVSHVVDGDTFDTTTQGRIRLADVDAPEYGEAGYWAAKSALSTLVNGATVYLDVDDMYETDPWGRLVCVVYVRYNETHYQNVNQALLDEGVVVIDNHDNEFDPFVWTRYVHEDVIPEFPTPMLLLAFIAFTILVAVVRRRKRMGPVPLL